MTNSFVTIDDAFGSDEIPLLLGRFVADPLRPRLRFTPPRPGQILLHNAYAQPTSTVGDQLTKLERSSFTDVDVKLVDVKIKNVSTNSTEITKAVNITRTLTHFYDAFSKLCADKLVNADLSEMTQTGDEVYLITSVRSTVMGVDGKYTVERRDERKAAIAATVPADKVAQAFFGVTLPSSANPSVSWSRQRVELFKSEAKVIGEQCNQIQYYIISIDEKGAVMRGEYKAHRSKNLLMRALDWKKGLRVDFHRTSEKPFHVLYILARSSNAIVDVIFTGGLDGTAEGTWTAKRFWPMWLPQKGIPNIRISAFGYQAGQDTDIGAEISKFAWDLLYGLQYLYADFDNVTFPHTILF